MICEECGETVNSEEEAENHECSVEVNPERALELVQEGRFHEALKYLDSEVHMTLYGEIERLAYASDMISNYQDRITQDLAEVIYGDREDE